MPKFELAEETPTYKIYGILQGEKDVDYSIYLPRVVEPGTIGRIAFYMWCIKDEHTTLLVDTGLTDKETEKMCTAKSLGGIKYLEFKLKQLNVDPAGIEKVIVSHLHADHFSAYQLYPKATFYIQKKEIEFHTGPGVRFRQVAQFATNMSEVISLAYAKRIRYVDGDEEIAPGIQVVLVGGHTGGSQVVIVTTSMGNAVVCADAIQLYRQLEESVVGMSLNIVQALLASDKIKALASSPELIIPGHDPLIMERFSNPIEGVVEIG